MEQGASGGILNYDSQSIVFALDWSNRRDKGMRLAIGSFVEDTTNRVEIVQVNPTCTSLVLNERQSFGMQYPATQVRFIPDTVGNRPDLLATSGDAVRLWNISDAGTTLELVMRDPRNTSTSFNAVTCFDWSEIDTKELVAGSTSGRLLLWDTESGILKGTLAAHEEEIFDCQWGSDQIVASSSRDGTIRMFDLRDKNHCTVVYETPRKAPVTRIAWNKLDPKHLGFTVEKSRFPSILDVRYPKAPLVVLGSHMGTCNAIGWSPHTTGYFCSVGDDCHTLIWDLSHVDETTADKQKEKDGELLPMLAYTAAAEINEMAWCSVNPEWVAICSRNRTQVLRM